MYNSEELVYEVVEINAMGDHTVIGRYHTNEAAEFVVFHMDLMCEELGTSYYVNDIREEY